MTTTATTAPDAETRKHGPRSARAALVEEFRARLRQDKSPLDALSAEERLAARDAFRTLPEVAGEPLPTRKRRKGSIA